MDIRHLITYTNSFKKKNHPNSVKYDIAGFHGEAIPIMIGLTQGDAVSPKPLTACLDKVLTKIYSAYLSK